MVRGRLFSGVGWEKMAAAVRAFPAVARVRQSEIGSGARAEGLVGFRFLTALEPKGGVQLCGSPG